MEQRSLRSSNLAVALSVASIVAFGAHELSPATVRAIPASVETRVLFAPTPVAGCDGSTHIAYEVHLTNFYRDTGKLQLERVSVSAGSTTLAEYGATDLDTRLIHPGAEGPARYGRTIEGGRSSVLHIWLTLPRGTTIPTTLSHRLVFTNEKGTEEVVEGFSTEVRRRQVVTLGPPLRGGDWFVHNGPRDHRAAHWGSILALNGRLTVPQRFAIDFIGLAPDGRGVRGDLQKSTNADWQGFGATVVAVADGVVRDVRNGVADHPPLVPMPSPADSTAASVYGNFVVLDIGSGTFVHYAHLQEKSVAVRLNQRVKRGELLGRLGNSGNTNGPHLHFNVTDAVGSELSEGLPFVFDEFELLGETTVEQAIVGEGGPAKRIAPVRCRALPLGGTAVRFRQSG